LIVFTTPSDVGFHILNLFYTFISFTLSHFVIGCTVIIPVPELIKYE
ncbi:ATP-binding protein, partial [Escherichia coli]|nr:ATP-binding protein [Escherichia coli]